MAINQGGAQHSHHPVSGSPAIVTLAATCAACTSLVHTGRPGLGGTMLVLQHQPAQRTYKDPVLEAGVQDHGHCRHKDVDALQLQRKSKRGVTKESIEVPTNPTNTTGLPKKKKPCVLTPVPPPLALPATLKEI